MALLPQQPSLLWALFGLDGRINREVFWLGNIGCGLLALPFARAQLMFAVDGETGQLVIGHALAPILFLVLLWSEIALIVKRLHDRGLTGWFALFLPIPILSIIGFVVVGVMRGHGGANAFGPGPNRRGT